MVERSVSSWRVMHDLNHLAVGIEIAVIGVIVNVIDAMETETAIEMVTEVEVEAEIEIVAMIVGEVLLVVIDVDLLRHDADRAPQQDDMAIVIEDH